MLTLQGQLIYLRALEPDDLEFIYKLENDESIWEISNTQTPYSKFLIKQYLENSHQDIYEAKQLRLVICNKGNNETIGLIDLFDFDPKNSRAGVGILIHDVSNRFSGFGKEALQLITNYSFTHLQLHQLYANISEDNSSSINLFSNFGFEKIGIKKAWNFSNGVYNDEGMYQLINPKF
jgi:diamine N-acetyltransferase